VSGSQEKGKAMRAANIESTMASYYAQRAEEYDRIFEKPERQADLRALRSFVLETFTNRHILEVACGTGHWTQVLARSAASVTATDLNDEVLEIARAKPIRGDNVTFQREDAYALPRFPQPFTAGFAGFWWSHVPKARLRSFLTGLHRTFAPGATMVFIDNAYVAGSSTPVFRRDADGNTYQKRTLSDGSTHEVLKNFPTESELRSALAGLATQVRVGFLPYFWTMTYVPNAVV
jgi:demethylmenaquinone methyltransferase/2-methoxy-6-polyprenyl-1,4-benzoquinol methylase